ncbi:MAG: GNAT family N-acetyltransferase [Deltaproteobacteria bacterium]|nr:MAG: GNAT family N-acetyltransferase [Deltaproteobacteria bacterium]TMQ14598.1 MAG: GNAT family N-acetyltransferase [Deltaproteobacteria bacterium]
MPALVTERLRLIPLTLEVAEAILDRDKRRAEALIGGRFPPGWPDDPLLDVGFPYARDAIRADPEVRLWGDSLVLLRDDPRVVGSVVFHGRPADGVAEIGYAIEERARGIGLASEATRACVDWAFGEAGIVAVQATTFPWHAASLGVIRKLGMRHIATRDHDTLGELLVFERRR